MISGSRQLTLPASPSKEADSFLFQHGIRQFLCPGEISDIGKRVIVHGERDALFAQEPGEVFAPVEVNLDVIRIVLMEL